MISICSPLLSSPSFFLSLISTLLGIQFSCVCLMLLHNWHLLLVFRCLPYSGLFSLFPFCVFSSFVLFCCFMFSYCFFNVYLVFLLLLHSPSSHFSVKISPLLPLLYGLLLHTLSSSYSSSSLASLSFSERLTVYLFSPNGLIRFYSCFTHVLSSFFISSLQFFFFFYVSCHITPFVFSSFFVSLF